MTKYLISFPRSAMRLTDEELQASSEDSHALVQQAKDAGVWVFGGAIDDSAPPVRVEGDGSVTIGAYEETKQLDGGFTILDVPSREAALDWAAKFARACRCAQEVRPFFYDPAS